MSRPSSRTELKEYCKRKLGWPVIEINLSEDQIDDSIDAALDFFHEYHYDGSERRFYVYKITQADIDNKYFILPNDVMSVLKVHSISQNAETTNSLFSATYQIRLNELWDMSSGTMSQFVISQQYVSLLNDMLNPQTRFRFRRHTHKLELDLSWSNKVPVDDYILVETWCYLDPEEYGEVYGNWTLRKLAAAYLRKQWARNLYKYESIQLPGGVTMNSSQILQDAEDEIAQLEQDFIIKYQEPDEFFLG